MAIKLSDLWGETGTLMVSERAKELLKSILGANVEFLIFVSKSISEEYYLVHVLNVLDAIDSNKLIF